MNFIITCGTSQTEHLERNETLTQLKLALKDIGYTNLQQHFNMETVDPHALENWLLQEAEPVAQAIANRIQQFIRNNPLRYIGTDTNPLGAELSTLFILFNQRAIPFENHRFYLLRSDTYKGWFNALILKAFFNTAGWGTVIGPECVQHLCEKPPTGSDPLLSLSRRLQQILQRSEVTGFKTTDQVPTIVMSGSFKSVIPCLTAYSLVFALPMIYLFETSSEIQDLTPVLDINNRSKYRSLWKNMSDLKVVDGIGWLREILEFRDEVSLPWL